MPSATAAVTLAKPDEDIAPYLLGDAEMVGIEDPQQIQQAITKAILDAPDLDSLLAPTTTTPAAEVTGRPLIIRGLRWMKSSFDEGPSVYVIIEAVARDTGELLTVSCGALGVMAKLYRATSQGWALPPVIIHKATKATANGYYPLDLIAAGIAE